MAVQKKLKGVKMKTVNKEDIPRLLKLLGPHIDMAFTQQHRNKCSK